MKGLADANLVLAVIKPTDALRARAKRHLEQHGRLTVPFSVGIELLLIARKHAIEPGDLIDMADAHFDLENRAVLDLAADALAEGELQGAFDAVHAAEAFLRGTRLHTADDRLLRSAYPTASF